MEKLATGLDVCQERLLDLIEKNSAKLCDQIEYWKCTKREQLLLFAARKVGCSRLGYEPVPSTKVSEHKAKEAIKMQLLLESLLTSQYGHEQWTLPQTSLELLNAPPMNCFKKNGEQLEVQFEGNPDKAVTYVRWDCIYSQDENSHWHKTQGFVNYDGLWYNDGVLGVTCYVSFAEEAEKYGNLSPWVVYTNCGPLLSPNSTSFNSDPPERPGTQLTQLGTSPPSEHRGPTPGRHISPRGQPCYSKSRTPPGCSRPSSGTSSALRGRGDRQRPGPRPFGGRSEEAAGKAQRRSGPFDRKAERRSGQNTCTSSQNPVIIYSGPPNKLKCWRSRCWKGYRDYFCDFSSGFTWLATGTRGKDACVLISFRDSMQMKAFRTSVPRPKDLVEALGHFHT